MSLLKPIEDGGTMSKQVDAIMESISENMLAGVVEAKYESLKEEINKIVDVYTGWRIMEVVKKYFPKEVEYVQQLADLKAVA